jgi:hypothetical protein
VKAVVAASGAVAVEGKVVTITGASEMGFGTTGKPLDGMITRYEGDGYMTVQIGRVMVVPGVSGSLPAAANYVVVNGAGAAISASAGKARCIASYPADNTIAVLIG